MADVERARAASRLQQASGARAEADENLDPSEVHFRTSPAFRTDAAAHRWLAETVFVALARNEDGRVCVRFFEVL